MNPSSGNKGVNHLAQVLAGQSKKDQDRNSALVLDFGEIMDDYSLQTNTFSIPIPVEDYHVCRQLTLGKTGDILAKTQAIGSPGSGEHNHTVINLTGVHDHVLIPEKMRRLKPGDRVLVAWVQSEAVVVDIICPAEDLKK